MSFPTFLFLKINHNILNFFFYMFFTSFYVLIFLKIYLLYNYYIMLLSWFIEMNTIGWTIFNLTLAFINSMKHTLFLFVQKGFSKKKKKKFFLGTFFSWERKVRRVRLHPPLKTWFRGREIHVISCAVIQINPLEFHITEFTLIDGKGNTNRDPKWIRSRAKSWWI